MSGKTLAAGVVFALLSFLPFVAPPGEAAVSGRSEPTRRMFNNAACVISGEYAAAVSVMNVAAAAVDVVLTYYDPVGSAVITQTSPISGPGTALFYSPPGFDGSAIVQSSGQQILAVVNHYGASGDGDSAGSGGECGAPLGFYGHTGPILDPRQPVIIQDLGGSQQFVAVIYKDNSGETALSPPFTLPANGQVASQVRDASGGDEVLPPIVGRPMTDIFDSIVSHSSHPGGDKQEPPDFIAALDGNRQYNRNYFPLPPGEAPQTFFVQNLGTSSSLLEVTIIDPQGNVVGTQSMQALAEAGFQGSAVVSGAGVSVGVVSGGSVPVGSVVQYQGFGANRAAGGTAAWRGASADRAISSRGYAFGAPSSQQSKVSAVLHNPGTKTVRVKLRVFDGDTGKKRQSGKASVVAGGTATVAFNQKARGDNLYVEIQVKGQGSVYAWLMRDVKGDIDFYPAIPR